MIITLIRKKGASGEFQNLKMETSFFKEKEDSEEVLICRATIADDELKDLSEPTIYTIDIPEVEFHTNLRKEAAEKEQLITSHSTDPELNPEGYTRNLDDESS